MEALADTPEGSTDTLSSHATAAIGKLAAAAVAGYGTRIQASHLTPTKLCVGFVVGLQLVGIPTGF